MYKGYIDILVKTNFKFVNDDSIIFLKINNIHVLVKRELKSELPLKIKVKKYKFYDIELLDENKTYKKKRVNLDDGSTIKIFSRKSPVILGLRGKIWEQLTKSFISRFTFKIKKQKK